MRGKGQKESGTLLVTRYYLLDLPEFKAANHLRLRMGTGWVLAAIALKGNNLSNPFRVQEIGVC